MEDQIQRKLGSIATWSALLPALATALLTIPALAGPLATIAKVPTDAGENARTLPLETARQLLDQSGRAQDLEYRPPLWDWTTPTVRRVAQAPAPTPPASQAAAPAPEEGDILDEVSVTATRRPVRQRDTTATTYSVKKEDFAAQGARTVTDALQLVPGFQGALSQGGTRNAGLTFLRGFDDQRFQVLRDGLSLTRPSNNRSDISGFSVDDLERIEVLTGGATLRYGSGSVGGVINLITETPKGPPKFSLRYEAGSYGSSRYVAKYGGGDDTFSYNFVFSSTVDFNNYPYNFTVPSTAQFYGPTVNSSARLPAVFTGRSNLYGPGRNTSFGLPGADPANNGPIDLFGFLKPEVGPPISVSGIAQAGTNAADNYAAKFVFKPDPSNRITLRLNQQEKKFLFGGPGTYAGGVCFGGPSTAVNPTLTTERFFPVDSQGNQLPCPSQRFLPATASFLQVAGPYNYNATLDGRLFAPGQSYPFEQLPGGGPNTFQRTLQFQSEVALLWDYDIDPTTSINSYAYYFRFGGQAFTPTPYFYNSNLPDAILPGPPGARTTALPAQPYFQGEKFELQTSLNTKISPGQDLSFGANLLNDRSYQQKAGSQSFFDQAITRFSFFLIDDISFSDQVKANVGVRYTNSNQFGELVTPAVGLRVSPTDFISFRANGSYVFNAPSISDLNVAGGVFVANPNLKPESGVTYDVGFDLTPVRTIGLRVTYFSTYLDGAFGNLVFRNPGTFPAQPADQFPFLQRRENFNSRLANGFEVAGDWQLTDQFALRVRWTNSDVRNYGFIDSPEQSTFPNFYQFQDPNIPFNNVVINANYQNKGYIFSLVGRYDGGKRRPGSVELVPSFFTLDFNAEVPITPYFTLTGNVFNIFDTQYEYLSGLPAPGTTFRVGGRLEIGG